MKWPSLNTILLIAVVILATLYIRSLFGRTPPSEKIIRADMKIEQLENQRRWDSLALEKARDKYDSLITVSSQRITDLEKQKQPIINVIKKTPGIVRDFNKEQLSRAITEFARKSQ